MERVQHSQWYALLIAEVFFHASLARLSRRRHRSGASYFSAFFFLSQTLVLGYNSLSDLSGLPWAALSTLENLDLSNNRLRTLGDVVLMTWLRRLNLENNEINPLPLELGLCTGSWFVALRRCCV